MSGDVVDRRQHFVLTASAAIAHRKAVLMIRQIARRRFRLRRRRAARQRPDRAAVSRRKRRRSRKTSSPPIFPRSACASKSAATFSISMPSGGSSDMHPAGASIRLPFKGDFYVGIGVCSHDKDVSRDRDVFERRNLAAFAVTPAEPTPALYSTLETLAITSDTPPRSLRRARKIRSAQLDARRQVALLFNRNGRILNMPIEGGPIRIIDTRFAIRATTTTASLPTARCSRSATIAARRQSRIRDLHRSRDRRLAAPHHAEISFVLARLVARRTDARVHRPAQRRVRHLHDSGGGRRRDTPHHRARPRRRAGVFARRKIYLFQFRAHRHDADLAHASRRQRAGASHSTTNGTTGFRIFRRMENGW